MAYVNGFARGTSRTLGSDKLKLSQHRAEKLRSQGLPAIRPHFVATYSESVDGELPRRGVSAIPVLPRVPTIDHSELLGFPREGNKVGEDHDRTTAYSSTHGEGLQQASIDEILLSDIVVALSLAEAGLRPIDRDFDDGAVFVNLLLDKTSRAWAMIADMYWHAPAPLTTRLKALDSEQLHWLYVHAANIASLRQARERCDPGALPAGPCEVAYEDGFQRAMGCALPQQAKHPDPIPWVETRDFESGFAATERWRRHFLNHVVPEEHRRIMGLCSVPDMVRVSECLSMQKDFPMWCGAGVDEEEGRDELVAEGAQEEEAEPEDEVESEDEDVKMDAQSLKKKKQKLSKQARQKRNRKLRQEAAEAAKAEEATSALDNFIADMELPFVDLAITPPGLPGMVDAGTQTEHDADEITAEAALALINIMSVSDKLSEEAESDSAGLLEHDGVEVDEGASREESMPGSPESHTVGRLTPGGSAVFEPDVSGPETRESDMPEQDLDFSQTRPLTPSPPPSPAPHRADVRRRRRSGTPEEALRFSQTRSTSLSPSRPAASGKPTVRLPGSSSNCNKSIIAPPEMFGTVQSLTPDYTSSQDPDTSEQGGTAERSTTEPSSSSQSTTSDQDNSQLSTGLERTPDPRRTYSDPEKDLEKFWKFYDASEPAPRTVSLDFVPGRTMPSRCSTPETADDVSSPGDGSPALAAQGTSNDDSQGQQGAFGGMWFGAVPCERPSG
ncbi:hypothetical protein BST61_g2844 [Cercospora zeina]